MQLTNQKRLAAKILGCGVHRVWINSDYIDMVASAVQTEDIREFIDQGIIKAKPVKGTSRARARVRLEQKRKGSVRVPRTRATRAKTAGCGPSGPSVVC